jgi:UDP-glucose:(heptosyl)LPS alpha-1,3-glucosyltransferase
MLRAYAAADAVVLPSWHDSFAFVVLEAAACGLPLITTRQTGAAELITEGVDGFVLDRPDDLATLADRMERLCDPAARAAIGRAARALAERHTLAVSYRQLTEVFERAAVEAPLTSASA